MTITARLAEFAATTPAKDIDAQALQVMRLSLLDWMAVGIAGRNEPVAQITRAMALDEGGTALASVIGSGTRLPPRAAALVNGATSHALDYDDTHFAHIGHPSVAILSAALAIAEATGASGEELLTAALIGVEASVRIGVWLGRGHYQTGFHQTATAGAFGAGLASARLMGFDADQCAMVLGLIATRASGLKSQFGTMGKPFNAGLAASNGVEASLLVAKGFEANPLALESAQGFGPTHAGIADETALDGLGQTWLFTSVSHKFHACCHGLHAVLEAAGSLDTVDASQIRKVDVVTHPRWMTVCNQPAPTTGLGAKFSYATVLPMHFLGHDTAVLGSYSDATCVDPAVMAMRMLVDVTADDRLTEMQAELTLTMTDGQTLHASRDLDAPIPLAEREAKLHAKAASLLGQDQADSAWAAITAGAAPDHIGTLLRA